MENNDEPIREEQHDQQEDNADPVAFADFTSANG